MNIFPVRLFTSTPSKPYVAIFITSVFKLLNHKHFSPFFIVSCSNLEIGSIYWYFVYFFLLSIAGASVVLTVRQNWILFFCCDWPKHLFGVELQWSACRHKKHIPKRFFQWWEREKKNRKFNKIWNLIPNRWWIEKWNHPTIY